jgi:hypothetical protein
MMPSALVGGWVAHVEGNVLGVDLDSNNRILPPPKDACNCLLATLSDKQTGLFHMDSPCAPAATSVALVDVTVESSGLLLIDGSAIFLVEQHSTEILAQEAVPHLPTDYIFRYTIQTALP